MHDIPFYTGYFITYNVEEYTANLTIAALKYVLNTIRYGDS